MAKFYVHTLMPIDNFTDLTRLSKWIADAHIPEDESSFTGRTTADLRAERTLWAARALFALQDAPTEWEGDFRHEPHVGTLPTPPDTSPYLVVKQDNNGTTFVIAEAALPLPDQLDTPFEVKARNFR